MSLTSVSRALVQQPALIDVYNPFDGSLVGSVDNLGAEAVPALLARAHQGVRESAALMVRYAKQSGTAIFLVGHVTKEGALAGPRVLEHMVDTVLYFEGESDGRLRLLRAVKNRFGAVNEIQDRRP